MSSRPRREKRGAKDTPSGVWLYGRHAVAAALANPARKIHRLIALPDVETPPAAADVAPEKTSKTEFDALLPPRTPHQGLAALCAPLPSADLDAVARRAAPGRPALVLDQVTDPQNVGAVLRSAAAFQAAGVIMQDRHSPPETGALAKAASGALDRIPIARVVNLVRALDELRDLGLWSVALSADGAIDIGAAPTDRAFALVLGAEGSGVRRLTRERCDLAARIPIDADQESLNVSAAAAVALYALTAAAR